MPKRIPEETKQRATRLVLDHLDEYPNLTVACETVAGRLGFGPESLRRWLRQAQVDAGDRGGVTSSESERIRRLERENRVVRSTRVPTALRLFSPRIKSPSQWPGTARSSTSAGRSLITTVRDLPASLRQSLTLDHGAEMAELLGIHSGRDDILPQGQNPKDQVSPFHVSDPPDWQGQKRSRAH